MTTVLIWNNNLITLENSYHGHAAVQMGDDWGSATDYVSWVPKHIADNGGNDNTFFKDLELEGYAPDHVIHMPDTMILDAMRQEWKHTKGKVGSSYNMVRENCSNVAARVLKAGSKKGSFLKRHQAIWTPLMVKRLAFDMGGVDRDWKWLLNAAMEKGLIDNNENKMLRMLKKRDERHGPDSHGAYYAKGQRIAPKIGMMSVTDQVSIKFKINMQADEDSTRVHMACYGGSVYCAPTFGQVRKRARF